MLGKHLGELTVGVWLRETLPDVPAELDGGNRVDSVGRGQHRSSGDRGTTGIRDRAGLPSISSGHSILVSKLLRIRTNPDGCGRALGGVA